MVLLAARLGRVYCTPVFFSNQNPSNKGKNGGTISISHQILRCVISEHTHIGGNEMNDGALLVEW